MKKDKRVQVNWCDSTSRGRWVESGIAQGYRAASIRTVGLLVKRTKHEVVVALNIDEDGDVSDVITIPRGCIRSITELRDKT